MRNLSIEQATEFLKEIISDTEQALELYPAIIAALAKFEGKKISKRIDTELKKINPKLSASGRYNSFSIELFLSPSDMQGYRDVSILHACKESSYGDGILANDLINYDALKKQLLKQQEVKVEKISILRDQLPLIENHIDDYLQIKNEMQIFIDSVPYTIREVFDLEFDVHKGRRS